MLYDTPNSTTIGFVEITKYINNALVGTGDFNYIFTAGIVILVFIMALVYLSNAYSPESALAVSSYIAFIISVLIFYAGMLGTGFPILFATLSGIGTAYLWFKK